jgi:hypothetical protein
MDIKSLNTGAGSRLNNIQNDSLQKKSDDSKLQQNVAQNKQRQDKLELSSASTFRSQAVKLNAIDTKKIDQKLSSYEGTSAYKETAKKLNQLFPPVKSKA